MMKRVYLLCAVAALALALAACGGSSSSSQDTSSSAPVSSSTASSQTSSVKEQTNGQGLDAAYDALLAANPISNPFELDALSIEYDFGLAPETVLSYKGVKSNDNGDAGLVLVISPPKARQRKCTALETYKEDQTAFYSNYAEFAQAKANVEKAIISGRDDQVVMVIASLEADADALSDAVDAAMN